MQQAMYRRVVVFHVLTLALCMALSIWHLLLVIWPAHTAVMAENKRVAHLLSALPQEYDVEGLLACTLLVSSTSAADVQTQLEEALHSREAAQSPLSPRGPASKLC